MAKAYHREANVSRWVGVRPAHNGEQIVLSGSVSNGTLDLYTVPSGYVLLLNAVDCLIHCAPAGAHYGTVRLYDTVPAIRYIFAYRYSHAVGNDNYHASFPIPLEAPVGWYLRLHSTSAAVVVMSSFHGFLVPTSEFA